MSTLQIKNWFHKMHYHPSHSFSWEMHHMVHDRVFWLIVALICFAVIMTALIAFGVWSSPPGGWPADRSATDDFFHYTF